MSIQSDLPSTQNGFAVYYSKIELVAPTFGFLLLFILTVWAAITDLRIIEFLILIPLLIEEVMSQGNLLEKYFMRLNLKAVGGFLTLEGFIPYSDQV